MLPLPPGGAPHLFVLAAIAALLGGLAAVERKGAFQLMLSRPLVLGAILGWALGDARGGLLLGVPLELLFLGGVNLGGSLPDNESLLAGLRAAGPMGLLSALEGGWHAVWAVSAACAIRAIRDPRAPFAAAISAAAVIAAAFAVRGLW